MITYTAKIVSLTCRASIDGMENVVSTIDWILTGEEGGFAEKASVVTLLPEADPSSFIAYADLTENTVRKWIADHTDEDTRKSAEAQIEYKLAEKLTPSKVWHLLPWMKNNEQS